MLDGNKGGKEEKKLQKVDQTGSGAKGATLNSQATTSTVVSSSVPGISPSHATVQTMEVASSSSHARSGASSETMTRCQNSAKDVRG